MEAASAGDATKLVQQVFGLDAEYSRDHWMVRADAVLSEWTLPVVSSPAISNPVRALAMELEGRYTLLPGLYAAVRAEHLAFSRIAGTARLAEWDAPVSRVEMGGGYYLQRNLILRLSVQVNRRDGGRVRRSTLPAAQLLFWF
jgi:predicted porin